MQNTTTPSSAARKKLTDLQQEVTSTIISQLEDDVCFNLSSDEGEPRPVPPRKLIERMETFIKNTKAVFKPGECVFTYDYKDDSIHLPKEETQEGRQQYEDIEHYYAMLFVELISWTGHPKRLNRAINSSLSANPKAFSMEMIVAELGAAFLCAEFKIFPIETGLHVQWIYNFIRVLGHDKRHILTAARIASEAVAYLHSLQPSR